MLTSLVLIHNINIHIPSLLEILFPISKYTLSQLLDFDSFKLTGDNDSLSMERRK